MKDYIIFSLRILNKNKIYALLSVFGLAIGITCCILIGLYVSHESSYDDFHKDADKIYRINTTGSEFTAGLSSFGIAPTLVNDYPEVEQFCRYMSFGRTVELKRKSKKKLEENVLFVDSSFFKVFGFKLLEGDPVNILNKPQTAVITQSQKLAFFGDSTAINETIVINQKPYQVVGIAEDDKGNSDISYSALLSMSSLPQQSQDVFNQDWFRVMCFSYIKFVSPPDVIDFKRKLDAFTEKYVKPWGEANDTEELHFYDITPIEEVHFDNSKEFDSPKGNLSYLYVFGSVALFVLLIACINYINLTLSQSTTRAKEIGVRKTLGSNEMNIRVLFLTETFIVSFFALLFSLLLVEILLPLFNSITLKSFHFGDLLSGSSVLWFFLLLITITILAGVYPAFVLSSYNPIKVLKGDNGENGNLGITRKVLITLQFAFSMSMIMSAFMIYNQMNFMKSQDLGFESENTLVFRVPSNQPEFVNGLEAIREEVNQFSSVQSSAFSGSIPGNGFGEYMFRAEQDSVLEDVTIRLMNCDHNFLQLLGVELIEGNYFREGAYENETKEYVVNESLVKKYGWEGEALGKRLQWGLLPNGQAENDGVVVGVVKDFHTQSLHNPIEALAIQDRGAYGYYGVKLQGHSFKEDVKEIRALWQSRLGDKTADSFFLDENFNQQYVSDERMLTIFNYFTVISILLSVLGLFALTTFMLRQRTKEIGIRKVLGATLTDLTLIISKEYVLLMIIALVVAGIPTYMLIVKWLDEFSYKIDFGLYPIVMSFMITSLIVFSVILINTLRITNFKPITALKDE